jgi:hypothetical protein
MKLIFILTILIVGVVSCSSPNITAIANELCHCKSLSTLEAETCFLKWEEQYGKVSLTESQRATFDKIVLECMVAKK